MERFARSVEVADTARGAVDVTPAATPEGVLCAVRHGLAWLALGNAIGVMLAILLLLPGWNAWLGEWTYGRWMMVHMNVLLFGWCALPMVAVLLRAYGADEGAGAAWCRPVVWLWSAALAAGSISWLEGHSSGKLFMDWMGYARVFFPLALLGLWALLAWGFARRPGAGAVRAWRAAGLVVLLAMPFALYFAASPGVYPAVNPDTGGPTGGSQLESTLGIVAILLAAPFALTRRLADKGRMAAAAWIVVAAEGLLCVALGRGDASHRAPAEWAGLGSVLVWVALVPAYYRCFAWGAQSRRWRAAFLWWWAGLVVTGWVVFLPGVLDRAKFTDVLVGHSLAAVAGFLSAFLLFVIAELAGERHAWIVNRTWSFWAWNLGVLAYVVVMLVTGWKEAGDPAFTIAPGAVRDAWYVLRLGTGVAMLAGSVEWLVAAAGTGTGNGANG